MTCCQAGETKAHWVFFFHWHFFWWFGTSVKVQKVSNFLGENFGNFDHWDSAFPNFRQGPIYNQTCSRLPIDPTSSILGPCPVPLLVLLSHACFTFHREIEGQTIEIIKTLQTPAEYIRLARNTQHAHHFLFQDSALHHWLSPHTYLNVYMFVCLYVHMFLRELQILDIRHWIATLCCIQIRRAKKICHQRSTSQLLQQQRQNLV